MVSQTIIQSAVQRAAAAQRDMTSLDILIASGRAPHETIGFLAQQTVAMVNNLNSFVQQSLQTASPA